MADIEIGFFFLYLIEKHIFFILAANKDSEKATKLLESLKLEGIDLHEKSSIYTQKALITLFQEKGLELPEKVIMSIDRTWLKKCYTNHKYCRILPNSCFMKNDFVQY